MSTVVVQQDLPSRSEPRSSGWLLFFVVIFASVALTVADRQPFNYVAKGLGALLVFLFLIRWIQSGIRPAPEVGLYLSWVIWCTVAILTAQPNMTLLVQRLITVLQMLLLIFILSSTVVSRRGLDVMIASMMAASLAGGIYAVMTGDYALQAEGGSRLDAMAGTNGLAWQMVLVTFGGAYFWGHRSFLGKCRYPILVSVFAIALYICIACASRKYFAGIVFFFVLWPIVCYRKLLGRKPMVAIAGMLVLSVAGVVVYQMTEETLLFERLARSIAVARGEQAVGGGQERIALYRKAFRLWSQYPIVGVGLGNYIVASGTLHAAHSEFASIASETGLVGVILYFGIYVVLWRRGTFLTKYSVLPSDQYLGRLIKVIIMVTLVISLGRWNYNVKSTWLFLAVFIGYSHSAKLSIREQRRAGEHYAPVAHTAIGP